MATTDELLLDDLLRLAAAASVTPLVEHDLLGLRRNWHAGSLVVVGHDLAEPLARTQPVRAIRRRRGRSSRTATMSTAVPSTSVRSRSSGYPTDESALGDKLADALDGGVRTAHDACLRRRLWGSWRDHPRVGGRGVREPAWLPDDADRRRPARRRIELALGIEHDVGDRWPKLLNASGRVSAAALRSALPSVDGLAVLSWDQSDVTVLPPETMSSVLGAAQRSSDLVVVDLPRRADPAVEEASSAPAVDAARRTVRRPIRAPPPNAWSARCARSPATSALVAREPRAGALSATDVANHLSLPLATKLRLTNETSQPPWTKAASTPAPERLWPEPPPTPAHLLDLYGAAQARPA